MTPLLDDQKRLRGFAKVTRDLTEQRRAHEQRIRLERAEEALRVRDEFLSDVKRNINSILTTIRIHVQSLKATIDSLSGETPPGIRAKLTTFEWGLERMSKTIDAVIVTANETSERLLQQLQDRTRR